MKELFTIGTSKKTAKEFFYLLDINDIKCVIDVRLKNTSQICGFTKYPDIEFLLHRVSNIKYIRDKELSPNLDLLSSYKNKEIDWSGYVKKFDELMNERDILKYIELEYPSLDRYCLMCSEDKPDYCHRRLLAELIRDNFEDYKIIHL